MITTYKLLVLTTKELRSTLAVLNMLPLTVTRSEKRAEVVREIIKRQGDK